jgi:excisionase family DNA binding protein
MRSSLKRTLKNELLTAKEAAALLQVSESTIRVWVYRKELDAVHKGDLLLVDRLDVETRTRKEG